MDKSTMVTKATLPTALVFALAVATVPHAIARAGSKHRAPAPRVTAAERVKDCTRVNGRYGYYGNPFCTPAEQLRFDRWEAGKLRKQ